MTARLRGELIIALDPKDAAVSKRFPVMAPPPLSAVMLILIANVVICAATAWPASGAGIPGSALFDNGAIYPGAFEPGERWRLVAATFLHANPAHLLLNMVSLLMIGPVLERRVGTANFLVIYLVAALSGSIASVALHRGAFLTVGASGALFGLLGASLALWVLGDREISPMFLLINLAMNAAFSASTKNIDIFAHIGGFAGGLIACAALDLIARANRFWLRCRFPEFVRIMLMLISAGPALALAPRFASTSEGLGLASAAAAAGLFAIKGIDLALAIRHGVALVAVVLAAMAGYAGYLLSDAYPAALRTTCLRIALALSPQSQACSPEAFDPRLLGLAVMLLALLANAPQLERGLADKGYVATALRAERRRSLGI
ncbi:MAG TPA: rhomboid family intramembrane serine protease [Acidisphaera sp.]|nr:rhomboid family intramembrane serine protease [Acidisphaera sp.]